MSINTVFFLLKWGILLLVIFFIYRFVVQVYFRILFYRKQGQTMGFLPIVGNSLKLKRAAKEYGDFCYESKSLAYLRPKTSIYGNALFDRLHIGVCDPNCIQDVLKYADKFFKSPTLCSIQKLILGEGLLFAEGALWKKHRKYSAMAFHYDSLKKMLPEVYNIANESLDNIKESSFDRINIIEEAQKITSEVIGRLFFGKKFSEYTFEGLPLAIFLEHLTSEASSIAIDPLTAALGVNFVKLGILKRHRTLLRNIKNLREFCRGIVKDILQNLEQEERKGNKKERMTMIEIFYDQIKNNPDDPLSEEELVNLFISFFAAGMDTTGHLIGMATYFLLVNPVLIPRILKEVDSVLDDPGKVTTDNLNSMDFTTAVLKETMRMAPPTPFIFPRESKEDVTIGGVKILKGDILTILFITSNFNDQIHEEPNKFYPDRWLTDSLTRRTTNANPFLFTPFSAGMRNCIGQHLGMFEARIILGLFLRKYEYEFADKNYVMRYNFRFLYEPDEPLIYKIKRKNQ